MRRLALAAALLAAALLLGGCHTYSSVGLHVGYSHGSMHVSPYAGVGVHGRP